MPAPLRAPLETSRLGCFIATAAAIAAATLVRRLLDPVLGETHPYILYIFPALYLANRAGWRQGAAALIVGASIANVCFVSPRGSMWASAPENQIGLLIFLLVGAAGIGLAEARRRAELQAEAAAADLRRTQDAFQGQQGRLLDHAFDPILTWRLDGGITFWNAGAERLYGYVAAEAVGQVGHDLLQTVLPGGRAAVEEALRRDGRWSGELRQRTKDGRWVTVDCRMTVAARPDGPLEVLEANRDVTERRLAEAAVEDALERFRGVVDQAVDGIVTIDERGVVETVNPAVSRIFGYAPDEVVGRNVSMLMPEPFRSDHDGYLDAYLRTGQARIIGIGREVRGRRKDGSEFPLELSVSEVRVASGWRFTGIVRDVSARMQAEGALRASEERLRMFLESVPAPIAMLDRGLRYLHCSRRWATDYRLGDEDLTGRRHFDVFADAPERWKEVCARCLEGEVIRCDEDRYDRADGGVQWIRWEVRPWRDEAGVVGGLIVFSEDVSERKRSEQTLRDRERLLGIVTGSARVGLVVVSERYEYLFANQAYAEIFGLDHDSIVGRRVPDVLAAGWSQIRPQLDRALAGEPVAYELTLPPGPADDKPRWFRVMYEPRRDEAERPTVVVVVADVTELKRKEDRIRESELRCRRLLDVLPDAVFAHDGEQIVFCNRAMLQLVGAESAEELIGRSPFDLAHPDYHDRLRTGLASMTEPGCRAPGVELRVRRRDGRTVPVYSLATMLEGPPRPEYLVALSDLTERERSVELLGAVMRSVLDAIVTIDERGTVLSVNPSTERLFGRPAADLVGKKVDLLMPAPHRDRHEEYMANYVRTGVSRVVGGALEVEALRSDGSTFPAEVTVTEFRLGDARCFTGVIRDLTDRRRLETQFRQAQKMEAVGQLAGGVAHDFNNLLTVINGYSELLLADLDAAAPSRPAIASILEAGERAAGLTGQLLAFSRQAVLEPKVLDVNALVAETAKMLTRLIGEDVRLGTTLDPRAGRVQVDPGQFGQVLMNLAVNARDAMPTGGRLTIETSAAVLDSEFAAARPEISEGRYTIVAVSDTGCGMTDDVKSRIFEPFYTTKGPGKGTGLGLATVYGIVRQSGGRIEVYSEVGLGTTFKVYLPTVADPESAPAPIETPAIRGGSETILLVEDQAEVRRLALAALRSCGYHVIEAADGRRALEQVDRDRPALDLLVTDVVMPGMSGSALAEQLHQRYSGLKVLYMSGYMDDAVVRHGLLQAEVAFLRKPYTPRTLSLKVREVLDQA